MVQYKDHSEWATFHVTGIGQTTIFLGHTWLMEHKPQDRLAHGRDLYHEMPNAMQTKYYRGDESAKLHISRRPISISECT